MVGSQSREKKASKLSWKCTVTDRIIKRMKTVNHQSTLPKVHINQSELENVYSFVYLGAEIAANGDREVSVQHRINVAFGDDLQNIDLYCDQPNSP